MTHPDAAKLRKLYRELLIDIAEALFRIDPIGINFDHNVDEYEPEARTILPRLQHCTTYEDARRAVYEEFVRWFGTEAAGPIEHYSAAAEEVWKIWQRYVLARS